MNSIVETTTNNSNSTTTDLALDKNKSDLMAYASIESSQYIMPSPIFNSPSLCALQSLSDLFSFNARRLSIVESVQDNVYYKDTNKLIIYLEPRKDSKLYKSIKKYYSISSKLIGFNEAHMYHPHSSMIGFLNLDSINNNTARENITSSIIKYMQNSRSHFIKKNEPNLIQNVEIMKRNNKIDLKFVADSTIHQFVRQLRDYLSLECGTLIQDELLCMNDIIRYKPIDHISLAYVNHHIKVDNDHQTYFSSLLDDYFKLAVSIVDLSEYLNYSVSQNCFFDNWNIVLYNKYKESTNYKAKHKFKQIYRM